MSTAIADPKPTQTGTTQATSKDILDFVAFLEKGGPGANAYVVLLGLRIFDSLKLLRSVEEGFSFKTLERFQRNFSLSQVQLTRLVDIAPRTLTRRRQEGKLTSDESDRLLRATRLFARALELFNGDTAAARRWLTSPQTALGGAVPFDLARTEVGSREIETIIGRIEHGVFS